MTPNNITIFLVEPLDKKKHKARLVYADNEHHARNAAANTNDDPSIYLHHGMSICIPVESDVLEVDPASKIVTVNYRDVIYHLNKDVAQDLISDSIF